MNTRQIIAALVAITAAHAAGNAPAGDGTPPYYDADTDTFVYRFVGDPVASKQRRSPPGATHGITPYYDEATDTVVYNFTGTPIARIHSQATPPAPRSITPYYDAQTDTVVYPHVVRPARQATAMMDAPG